MSRRRRAGPPLVVFGAVRALLCRRIFEEADWLALTSEDCHVRIGNLPASVGRPKALEALSNMFLRGACLRSGHWDPCAHNDAIYVECEFDPGTLAAIALPVPCMWVFRPASPPFADIRVYVDLHEAQGS